MNSLPIIFRDASSPSYFSRKLFEFGAYANSLDHLDCSHCALAVFIIIFLFQEANFYTQQWTQLLKLTLVLLFFTIWISDCLCLTHIASQNQDELTVSLFQDEVHCPILWASCSNLELMQMSLPINESICWNLLLCYFSWLLGFQIGYVWLT